MFELFKCYQQKCSKSTFEPLFDHDTSSIIKAFVLLKITMVRCIIRHIPDYHDEDKQEVSDDELYEFKKQLFYFVDKQINTKPEYIQVKTLWKQVGNRQPTIRINCRINMHCTKEILSSRSIKIEAFNIKNITTIKIIIAFYKSTKRFGDK